MSINPSEVTKLLKDQIDAVTLVRSKDNKGQLLENTQILIKALSVFNDSWDGRSFNVIWDIKDSNNKSLYIYKTLQPS
mgnify:CR=1 FL=1